MPTCDCGCTEERPCLTRKLRYWRETGGLQIDPRATPSRRNTKPPSNPRNSWEKGIPTDSRGMPFLKPDLSPIGQKEFGEKRHAIEQQRRDLHAHNAHVNNTDKD